METYKDNPIISGALNIISKSPVVNALTSTADLIKNKSELVKDFLEPRIEELNKNFNKFEQVYNTINSEYYNYEGDAPPIFDVDGASTAKAEAKMITDFNAEFVDPVTGIVNIPYDEQDYQRMMLENLPSSMSYCTWITWTRILIWNTQAFN
jgi:hypothetical protein